MAGSTIVDISVLTFDFKTQPAFSCPTMTTASGWTPTSNGYMASTQGHESERSRRIQKAKKDVILRLILQGASLACPLRLWKDILLPVMCGLDTINVPLKASGEHTSTLHNTVMGTQGATRLVPVVC